MGDVLGFNVSGTIVSKNNNDIKCMSLGWPPFKVG